MIRKLKIGVDVDGVIFDYMVLVRAYAELYDFDELHKNGVVNKAEMKVGKRYNWTKEELKTFADRYFVELSKTTVYNPLVIEIINKLQAEGHELYIISNRGIIHEEAITIVEDRFKEANLNFNGYFWKTDDKTEVLLNNKMDIMIDDSPDVCLDAANNNIAAIYFREKDSIVLDKENIYDVDNWAAAYRHINEVASKN